MFSEMCSYLSAKSYFRKSTVYETLKKIKTPEELTAEIIVAMGTEYYTRYKTETWNKSNQAAAQYLMAYKEAKNDSNPVKSRWLYLANTFSVKDPTDPLNPKGFQGSWWTGKHGVISRMINDLLFQNVFGEQAPLVVKDIRRINGHRTETLIFTSADEMAKRLTAIVERHKWVSSPRAQYEPPQYRQPFSIQS